MLIKIHKGTPNTSGASLCLSCHHAGIMRGERESEVRVNCSNFPEPPPFNNVVECSAYSDKSKATLQDMRELAWVLVTDRARTKIGFEAPDEWKRNNKGQQVVPRRFDD